MHWSARNQEYVLLGESAPDELRELSVGFPNKYSYRHLIIYLYLRGKEALVEKFKNSAIMDERESWRPRIFYSSGDNAGLPESFPAPTHIGRKERSSYNRDTLFPPGVNSHTIAAQSHGLLQNTPRRYLDDMRSFQNHGRSGGGERYRSHGHNADESGEPRRASMFRNSSQRTAR